MAIPLQYDSELIPVLNGWPNTHSAVRLSVKSRYKVLSNLAETGLQIHCKNRKVYCFEPCSFISVAT